MTSTRAADAFGRFTGWMVRVLAGQRNSDRGQLCRELAIPAWLHLAVIAGGIVVGLLGTAVLSRLLTALLFGVPRHDSLTFALVTLVLLLACAVALIVPARRAARVDAVSAPREE